MKNMKVMSSQNKSSQVKFYCSKTGNYACNEISQIIYTKVLQKNKIHINENCAPLEICIVNSGCLRNKRGMISASHKNNKCMRPDLDIT